MSDQQRSPSEHDRPFIPEGEPLDPPAGQLTVVDADTWYYFRAQFLTQDGTNAFGYFHPVGPNPSTSFWDYICMRTWLENACQFKLEDTDQRGWSKWLIRADGNHLALKATFWYYRASAYTARFAIVDGLLYNDYKGGPAGAVWDETLVTPAYYVGQDLGDRVNLTQCQLVPVGAEAEAAAPAAAGAPGAVTPS
ncbi:hypothetical protein GCM10010492_69340 [Saccharothrix mutabilis subsp. mutabilis]|uniref:Uncharacterized protein n=1 Tax=Saccharothrix mutabilis subsp. mutabilis TaxID=66855 RepID=A0ABN0UQV1_9PSEU